MPSHSTSGLTEGGSSDAPSGGVAPEEDAGGLRLQRLLGHIQRRLAVPVAAVAEVTDTGDALLEAVGLPEDRTASPEWSQICREVAARVAAAGGPLAECASRETCQWSWLAVPLSPCASRTAGALLVADTTPREWSSEEIERLRDLALAVDAELERGQGALRAEAALQRSEGRYRHLVDTAYEGIWTLDRDRRITYANRRILEMLGYSEPEVLGHSLYEFFFPEDVARVHEHQARRERGLGEQFDFRLRRRDGSELWVIVKASPILDEQGCFVGALGMLTDATERHRTEEALRQSEARFRAMFDQSAVGIAVVGPDARAWQANRALEVMLGYGPGELIGVYAGDFTHPDDLPADYALYLELLEGKRDHYRLEKRYFRKDGGIVWGRLTASLIRDAQGTPLFGIAVIEDITEQKRSQERDLAFLTLGQLLNAAASPEEAARVVLGMADKLLGWDCAWLSLAGTDGEGGRPVLMIDVIDGQRVEVPPPDHDLPRSPLAQRVLDEGPLLIRREPHRLQGPPVDGALPFGDLDRRAASLLVVPIRHGETFIGALSIQSYTPGTYTTQDLETLQALAEYCAGALRRTQAEALRDQLEQQLLQSQKLEAIGLLAGGVAHDFNNMLAVINGYADLLRRMIEPESPLQEGLGEIGKAGDRAAALTRQLLAFSRKQMLEARVLDLNEVVENTSRMLQRLIGEDVRLDLALEPGLWPVKADANQVEQVLLNLAVNARDAMPRGGRLTLRTRNVVIGSGPNRPHADLRSGDYVLLTIRDTGSGMAPEVLQRIWEPFYTTKELGLGTGLGLATVYGIVKQSGGHIEVESREGEGTTFRIFLPRTRDRATPAAPEAEEAGRGAETILVVEDEALVGGLVRKTLRQQGYTVLEAANVDQAVDLLRRNATIDLVVSDVVMPGASGAELLAWIREHRPGTPVLFMSGYTDDEIVRLGVDAERVPFLQKPFLPMALAQKVRELLDSRT